MAEKYITPFEIKKMAEKYTSKILGYEKQMYTSKEWDWIEKSFIDGYNKGYNKGKKSKTTKLKTT